MGRIEPSELDIQFIVRRGNAWLRIGLDFDPLAWMPRRAPRPFRHRRPLGRVSADSV